MENEVQITDNYPQTQIKIDDLNNEKFTNLLEIKRFINKSATPS